MFVIQQYLFLMTPWEPSDWYRQTSLTATYYEMCTVKPSYKDHLTQYEMWIIEVHDLRGRRWSLTGSTESVTNLRNRSTLFSKYFLSGGPLFWLLSMAFIERYYILCQTVPFQRKIVLRRKYTSFTKPIPMCSPSCSLSNKSRSIFLAPLFT